MRNTVEQGCYAVADALEWVARQVVSLGTFIAPHRHLLDFAGFDGGRIVHHCVNCPARRYSQDGHTSTWDVRERSK